MTKAIRIHQTGGPEVLKWEDVEVPAPKQGEARIRHTAVGLNYIDTYHRSGLYPLPLPTVIGGEGAGVVEAVGPGVTDIKVGRPGRLRQRADRLLCRGAHHPRRTPGQDPRRHHRPAGGIDDAEGPDDAVPDPHDLSREEGRHDPAARSRRRRRLDPVRNGPSTSAPP